MGESDQKNQLKMEGENISPSNFDNVIVIESDDRSDHSSTKSENGKVPASAVEDAPAIEDEGCSQLKMEDKNISPSNFDNVIVIESDDRSDHSSTKSENVKVPASSVEDAPAIEDEGCSQHNINEKKMPSSEEFLQMHRMQMAEMIINNGLHKSLSQEDSQLLPNYVEPAMDESAAIEFVKLEMHNIATAAMDEFMKIIQVKDILVFPSTDGSSDIDIEEYEQEQELPRRMTDLLAIPSYVGSAEINVKGYERTFPRRMVQKPSDWKTELSRETGGFPINHLKLLDILLNVERWSAMFSAIIARAEQIEVISTATSETFNGMLLLIQAEYQALSLGLPTRENYFLRYCKQHGPRIWAVIDVAVDYFHPFRLTSSQRWPSGCLIKEKPMGCSKVTWIDHVEVDGKFFNNMYQSLVESGFAFGAKRWIAILQRQSERLAFLMASNNLCGEFGVISTEGGSRRSLLRLSERMVTSFCSGFGSSYKWSVWPNSKISHGMIQMRMTVDDPLCGEGTAITAVTSFSLCVKPDRLFDYLLNKNFRYEWDFQAFGGLVKQTAHVFLGNHPGNCVSLLRVDDAVTGTPKNVILIESNTDVTGSQIVYTPLCIHIMQELLDGGNPETVFIFPSGFNIHPGPVLEDGISSSLVTFSLKALIDSKAVAYSSQKVQAKIEKAVMDTISRIDTALEAKKYIVHLGC